MSRNVIVALLALQLLLAPVASLAQEASSSEALTPVLFFLHHTEDRVLGIVAVAPVAIGDDSE